MLAHRPSGAHARAAPRPACRERLGPASADAQDAAAADRRGRCADRTRPGVLLIPRTRSRRRSNSPLGIRTVEWLRDNGAAGIVAKVESIYYSLTAPSKGGPTLKALPKVGYGARRRVRG